MSQAYNEYLRDHIANVDKGFKWIKKYIGMDAVRDILPDFVLPVLHASFNWWEHDTSKTHPAEYNAYDAYFYGPDGIKSDSGPTEAIKKDFDKAWLRHIHLNPHHWQHWVLVEDDNNEPKPIEMPDRYILEMLCDWWSFSWRSGNLYEVFNWWNDHTDKIIFAEETRKKVEELLRLICDKLNELGGRPEDYPDIK
jgi:hypothetical protein